MKRRFGQFCLLLFSSLTVSTQAQETTTTSIPEETRAKLKAEISAELKSELEIQKSSLRAEFKGFTEAQKPKDTSLQFSGDLRLRHQTENKNTNDERRLQRLQARLGILAPLHDNFKITMRLMTSKDAVSGNQTMGDPKNPPAARRDFGLDLAYFDYQPFEVWTLWGGKMPQPFSFAGKNQMLLDRDISPEGFATRVRVPLVENWDLQIQGGSFWIRENYDDSIAGSGVDQTDNFMNGGQISLLGKLDAFSMNLTFGNFSYTAIKDQSLNNFFPGTTPSVDKGRGNTLYSNNNINYYPTNFDIQEKSLELKYKEAIWDFGIFGSQLKNIDADTLNEAKTYGLFGNYKDFAFSWAQIEVQKDAVFALFTDSDFGGGETSSRGQIWSLAYKITKKITASYTYFANKTSIDTSSPLDYKRSHIDLFMSF